VKYIEIGFILLVVIGIAGWLIRPGQPGGVGIGRRQRDAARWQVDDNGVNAQGDPEVAIELCTDGVAQPYHRRVIGTHRVGDHDAWGLLWIEATETAAELNAGLDRARQRRG
jgi:hypothetical protein